MSNFIYSTAESFGGPWLLDQSAIVELDEVVEQIWDTFSRHRDEVIEKEIEHDLNGYEDETRRKEMEPEARERAERYARQRKTIKLKLASSRYVECESISELIGMPELIDENPQGLEVDLRSCDLSATLDVSRVPSYSNDLSLRVSPETHDVSREAFVSLTTPDWAFVVRVTASDLAAGCGALVGAADIVAQEIRALERNLKEKADDARDQLSRSHYQSLIRNIERNSRRPPGSQGSAHRSRKQPIPEKGHGCRYRRGHPPSRSQTD